MGWLQLAIVLMIPAVASGKPICDSWVGCDPPKEPKEVICDRWDCTPPPADAICDNWDCDKKKPKEEWKRPPKNWGDVLRLKCENLPFRTYWDRKWLICVDLEPTSPSCGVLHHKRGTQGITGIPIDVRRQLESMNMLAEQQSGGMVNCVWDFGFNCGNNGTLLGDRCVEVVNKEDTFTNGGNDCKKKGFTNLYVPHDDNDIQLLLVHLMEYNPTVPAFWVGVSNPSTMWLFEDSTVTDFFRWKDRRVFEKVAQAGLFQSRPREHAYAGYIDVQKTTVKAPYICSRDAGHDYWTPYIPKGGSGGGTVINDRWDDVPSKPVINDRWPDK